MKGLVAAVLLVAAQARAAEEAPPAEETKVAQITPAALPRPTGQRKIPPDCGYARRPAPHGPEFLRPLRTWRPMYALTNGMSIPYGPYA